MNVREEKFRDWREQRRVFPLERRICKGKKRRIAEEKTLILRRERAAQRRACIPFENRCNPSDRQGNLCRIFTRTNFRKSVLSDARCDSINTDRTLPRSKFAVFSEETCGHRRRNNVCETKMKPRLRNRRKNPDMSGGRRAKYQTPLRCGENGRASKNER